MQDYVFDSEFLEKGWAEKLEKIDRTDPEQDAALEKEVMNEFLSTTFKTGYHLVDKFSTEEQPDTDLEGFLDVVMELIPVTQAHRDGTHPDMVAAYNNTLGSKDPRRVKKGGAVPKEFNDFADLPLTDEGEETSRRTVLRKIMTAWYSALAKFETRIMYGDDKVWSELEAEEGFAASQIKKLRLQERWGEFSYSHQLQLMRFAHKTCLYCRVLCKQKPPAISSFRTIMQEIMKSEGEPDMATLRRLHNTLFDDFIHQRKETLRAIDEALEQNGGIAAALKELESNKSMRDQMREALHDNIDTLFDNMDKRDKERQNKEKATGGGKDDA